MDHEVIFLFLEDKKNNIKTTEMAMTSMYCFCRALLLFGCFFLWYFDVWTNEPHSIHLHLSTLLSSKNQIQIEFPSGWVIHFIHKHSLERCIFIKYSVESFLWKQKQKQLACTMCAWNLNKYFLSLAHIYVVTLYFYSKFMFTQFHIQAAIQRNFSASFVTITIHIEYVLHCIVIAPIVNEHAVDP